MSWFEENKGLGTFLAAAGLGIVGLGVFTYMNYSKYSEEVEKFERARSTVQRLERSPLFPSEENVEKKKLAVQDFEKEVLAMQSSLSEGLKVPEEIDNTQFQKNYLDAVVRFTAAAKEANVVIPEKFSLGLDEYLNRLPNAEATAELSWQLNGIEHLLNELLKTGIVEITGLNRAPLPVESQGGGQSDNSSGNTDGQAAASGALLERREISLGLIGDHAALQKVVSFFGNSQTGGYLYALRLVGIESESKDGPTKDDTWQGDVIEVEAPEAPPVETPPATPVVDAPDTPNAVAGGVDLSPPAAASGEVAATPAAADEAPATGSAPAVDPSAVTSETPGINSPATPGAPGPGPANAPVVKQDARILMGLEKLEMTLKVEMVRVLPPAKKDEAPAQASN